MATTLNLKIRERGDRLVVSVNMIRELINAPDEIAKERLFNFFDPLKENEPKIHDKVWLEQLVNWTPPQKGLPVTELVKWMKLQMRIDDLDDKRGGTLTLNTKQVDLIWQRLKDPEYKLSGLNPAFVGFLMDFQESTQRWFDEFEPEEEEETEPEEPKGKEDGRKQPKRDTVSTKN